MPQEIIASLTYGSPFDYLVVTDHLRSSPRDPEGNKKPTARWEAIHQCELLYSYDTTDDAFHANEEERWGPRVPKADLKLNKDNTFEAIEWLNSNYPESFVLPNHPSRHNGDAAGVVTIEDLRKMNGVSLISMAITPLTTLYQQIWIAIIVYAGQTSA